MLNKKRVLSYVNNMQDGWTPLIAAAYCGEAEIVEMLVKAGADVKAACRVRHEPATGTLPLLFHRDTCVHRNQLECSPVCVHVQDGDTAVHYASAQG